MSERGYGDGAVPVGRAVRPRPRGRPGGVNSPVRAFGAVGGTPRFMASGRGPYLTDVDGNRYVDLVCSWGPMILGSRASRGGRGRARRALRRAPRSAPPTAGEVELAEEIVARVAPVEQVRLVSSGTEATMSAIRLARGFTGRQVWSSSRAATTGTWTRCWPRPAPGVATFGLPDTPGRDRRVGRRHDRAALQRR